MMLPLLTIDKINVSPNSDLKRDLPSGNDGVEWTWEVEAYNITDS